MATMRTEEVEAAAEDAPPSADGRISSLPHVILLSILSFLPLKESMRTSVLASRWRHLWTLAPLDFHLEDETDLDLGGSKSNYWRRRRRNRVAQLIEILYRHRGPIRSFRLSPALWRYLLESGLYDSLLHIIVRGGTQRLTIGYKIPPQLLTCHSLRTLDLLGCNHLERIVALPPNLTELKLGPSTLYTESYRSYPPLVVFACQSLCSLELREYYLCEPLHRPLPPNLRELILRGCELGGRFVSHVLSSSSLQKLVLDVRGIKNESFVIEDAPNIEILLIEKDMRLSIDTKILNAPKLRVLGCVGVSTLEFGTKWFENGTITGSGAWVHSIKTLAVEVELHEPCQVKAVAESLKCFPCLENLHIMFVVVRFFFDVDEDYWEKECSFDCLGHCLKMVNMKGFQRLTSPARYFVRTARLLKVISLLCYYQEKEEAIKHELALNNRASPDLQVIFETGRENIFKFSTLKYLC